MCAYCGRDDGCDCIERRDCKQAGTVGHINCGPCLHDAVHPAFACISCFTSVGVMERLARSLGCETPEQVQARLDGPYAVYAGSRPADDYCGFAMELMRSHTIERDFPPKGGR